MKYVNLVLTACLGGCFNTSVYSQKAPNVICILADDLGYTDLGCYGATKIKTPALDALASEGVRFTNAYSPASTSSPSRYALLTGEYAWRKNVGILPADAPLSIDVEKNTLPKVMQQLGYRTGIVGKWHLGLGHKMVQSLWDLRKSDLIIVIISRQPTIGFHVYTLRTIV